MTGWMVTERITRATMTRQVEEKILINRMISPSVQKPGIFLPVWRGKRTLEKEAT